MDDDALRALGILPAQSQPPFDIIGDVHGCAAELRELLGLLGYQRTERGFVHESRRLVFVGDLVDRGPDVVGVLSDVLQMVESGTALCVIGNHDHKFLRWIHGRNVQRGFGLAQSIEQVTDLPDVERDEFIRQVAQLFEHAPGYLLLDDGKLVVTHGAIRDQDIGQWNEHVAALCMFGDVLGVTSSGKPNRRDWAAARDMTGASEHELPRIVYGHTVVPTLRWVNLCLNLDTGCVYGGSLSALCYPELETVQVPARAAYATRGHG